MELEDNFFLLTAFLNHRAFLLSGSIPILRGGPLFRENTKLLNGEILYSLEEARIVIENWRKDYYTKRPHSSLGYRPPAPESYPPQRPSALPKPAPPGACGLANTYVLN
jgi:transposase InsO family protein